jgi:hypoxanthine-guanine phosphoribosyltransferase
MAGVWQTANHLAICVQRNSVRHCKVLVQEEEVEERFKRIKERIEEDDRRRKHGVAGR